MKSGPPSRFAAAEPEARRAGGGAAAGASAHRGARDDAGWPHGRPGRRTIRPTDPAMGLFIGQTTAKCGKAWTPPPHPAIGRNPCNQPYSETRGATAASHPPPGSDTPHARLHVVLLTDQFQRPSGDRLHRPPAAGGHELQSSPQRRLHPHAEHHELLRTIGVSPGSTPNTDGRRVLTRDRDRGGRVRPA